MILEMEERMFQLSVKEVFEQDEEITWEKYRYWFPYHVSCHAYHLLISDKILIGGCLIQARHDKTFYLKNFGIDPPEYRKHGFATFLLQEVVKLFPERPLSLHCKGKLEKLYAKGGFIKTSNTSDIIEMVLTE